MSKSIGAQPASLTESPHSADSRRAAEGTGASSSQGTSVLRSVLSTEELNHRRSRPADHATENAALIALARQMAVSPTGILQTLAETALKLCNAHSAGISLLETDGKRFYWPAIAGQWAEHLGGGTPREYGPCGTVLDRNAALLFSHPERDFDYFAPVRPLVEEALLMPFYINGKAVGTIWIIAHDQSRRFEREDLRLMTNLGTFAASAYQALMSLDAARRAEQEFRDLAENANVALHWVGPDGKILWANRTELEMLGYTAEEYIGHHIAEFHADPAIIQDILQRLGNRETLRDYYARLRCRDGSVRHSLINSSVLWEGDKFIHTRCFTRDITDRVRNEEQIAILGREAEHRAKNVLATVQATIHLTQADTAEGFKQAITGRIQALASVQALFVESRWRGAELRNLVAQELSPYCQDGETRVSTDGPSVLLEPGAAQTIAVCLHELATNAAKYGALSLSEGNVQIEWSRETDNRLFLRWTENGGPLVTSPTRRGFGTRVMEGMIKGQLKGEMVFDWRAEGLMCQISVPA